MLLVIVTLHSSWILLCIYKYWMECMPQAPLLLVQIVPATGTLVAFLLVVLVVQGTRYQMPDEEKDGAPTRATKTKGMQT
jgi:hypothetical protein